MSSFKNLIKGPGSTVLKLNLLKQSGLLRSFIKGNKEYLKQKRLKQEKEKQENNE